MNRINELRKFITKEKTGLEIAPYHAPIVPKSQGFDVKILDVFDTDRLRENARVNPRVKSDRLIEPVDYVGSACDLGDIITDTKFDYIVSSHNFEHLPNPIKFLKGVSNTLKDDGVLTMAIPDLRKCFDRYKWPTVTGDVMRYYHQNRERNDPFDVFISGYLRDIEGSQPVDKLFETLKKSLENPSDEYVDTHVTRYTPTSFVLIMADLLEFNYIDLQVKDIVSMGIEFVVHMKKTKVRPKLTENQRKQLHNTIVKEMQSR